MYQILKTTEGVIEILRKRKFSGNNPGLVLYRIGMVTLASFWNILGAWAIQSKAHIDH